jgi:c-di-GMP-binding flagellar brake protein YcgR
MNDRHERTQHRHTLSLHMEVYRSAKDKEPLFKCRTRNIGLSGVNIRNRDKGIRKGSKVIVLLKADCRSVRKEFPIEATVVWKSPTAIGMAFSAVNKREQQEFKRFLFEAKISSHSRARKRWYASNNDNITATILSQVKG